MEEKIKEINSLNYSIGSLIDFLWLLESSDIDTTYGKNKRNEFSMFWAKSYLWTGSDNPGYEKNITDRETMNELSKVMKVVLASQIVQKKLKLQSLLSTTPTQ